MNSLIDFDAIGDVVINLTNRLSEGVGWIANRETPQKAAIHTYIEEIQKSDHPPLIKAALISNAKKTIKEYCNQNNIVQIAVQSLEEKAKPEMIEEDWLAQFMDKARLVSSEGFQLIWGKILAGECNEPGMYELPTKTDLRVGNVIYTNPGFALYKAIEADKIEGFWETYCLPFWKSNM